MQKSTRMNQDVSEGVLYVKSLRDAVKRRYATEYLAWLRSGRTGSMPPRGILPPAHWKTITTNLDALG